MLIYSGGFQLLHAVYAVEKFLENLVKRHCQFHVVFFEGRFLPISWAKPLLRGHLENANLCIPNGLRHTLRSRYLLAREVIKRHLSIRLPSSQHDVELHTFPSLESREFKEYLHEFPIHFVMSHDGTGGSDRVPGDEEAKTLLRGLIWWFNTRKLNVALINRIEFRDSKVFTMIVESLSLPSRLELSTKQIIHEISETRSALEKIQEDEDEEAEASIGDINLEQLSLALKEAGSSESFSLAVYTVCEMFRQQSCNVFMASAFLLHSIILRHIPISQRRMPLIGFDPVFEEGIVDFLSVFSAISQHVLKDQTWIDLLESNEIECDIMDLVDGRLFRVVIQALCNDSLQGVMPQPVRKDWEILSRLVKQLVNKDLSLQGSDELEFSRAVATDDDSKPVSEELAVLPFSNPVFDKHLECIHITTDTSFPARMKAMKLYREPSYFQKHRKPLTQKPAPTQTVSKWRYVA
jgi:hypothetical protein